MKRIFKYLSMLLSVALVGSFTACNILNPAGELEDLGLGIKVFFPTKVVAGQPMTINGSGLSGVKEIVFPDGVSVTDFEIVSNDMIRVTAPSGIAAAGGNLIVKTADDQAESPLALTLGHTQVTGFSVQPGEELEGGSQITVFGSDLEFINSFEILDPDGNPLIVPHEAFYRKGTSNVIITLPKKIFEGSYVTYLHTYDGQTISLPELAFKPAADGGHWETVKTVIWENDGSKGSISWGGDYRFSSQSNSTGEEIYAIPDDLWEKMKTGKFYLLASIDNEGWYNMRITTGWWSTTWTGADIGKGDERILLNEDGTYVLEIDFTGDPILDVLDVQHLLFTGEGYTPLQLYFAEDVWVGGDGHMEIVRESIWKNDGSKGSISWSGDYRFSNESNSTGEEIYAIPDDQWEKMKTGTFYLHASIDNADWYNMRITTGWWSTTWTGADIGKGDERIVLNDDGTYTIAINFDGDPILDVLDAQHLLFTGEGYTPLELYFEEEVWVGGGDTPSEYDIAPFTMYQDRSDFVSWPFYPSWSDDKGKWRIMRGIGDPAIEAMGLTTSSKFVVYKEVGTTGQIQWNDPNWGSFAGIECNDWDGSAETIEVPVTEDMLKCINGEVTDGWSDTAIILQGDGLTVTKIVIVP